MVCVILRKVSSPPLLFPPPQFPEIDQSPRRRWFDDPTYRNVTTSVPPCSLAFTLADLDNGIGKEIAKIVFKVFFWGDYMWSVRKSSLYIFWIIWSRYLCWLEKAIDPTRAIKKAIAPTREWRWSSTNSDTPISTQLMRKHNLFQSFLLIVDLVLSHGGYFWDQVEI